MLNQKNILSVTFRGICLSALTMVPWFATYLPVQAANITSAKDYRLCAFQLLKAGVTEENASKACAEALYPEDVSACVLRIERQTKLAAQNILATCEKSRRPKDLAQCVNGISRNLEEGAKSATLDYCGRSLLPVRFANCVVGLRAEIKFEPIKAMDTCIDASDLISNTAPSFIPAGQNPQQSVPSFEIQPIPENMEPTPENTQPTPENTQPTPENTEQQ
ncbi:MAG: hypothetical protein QNJ36_22335 [Calothrix sp. MO_167.B42]|nr:hypothetical protein [Calothrix sp. MO_167.B42]